MSDLYYDEEKVQLVSAATNIIGRFWGIIHEGERIENKLKEPSAHAENLKKARDVLEDLTDLFQSKMKLEKEKKESSIS